MPYAPLTSPTCERLPQMATALSVEPSTYPDVFAARGLKGQFLSFALFGRLRKVGWRGLNSPVVLATHTARYATTMWLSCAPQPPSIAPESTPAAPESTRSDHQVSPSGPTGPRATPSGARSAPHGDDFAPSARGGEGGGNGLIFVSVACYRDPECQWTLQSMFASARCVACGAESRTIEDGRSIGRASSERHARETCRTN
eukprot:1195786-Prorocentrum_minimum.AAC.7